jgi:hypothetical protein
VLVTIELNIEQASELILSALEASGHDCGEVSIQLEQAELGQFIRITATIDLPIQGIKP